MSTYTHPQARGGTVELHLDHLRLLGLSERSTIYPRRRVLIRLAAALPVPLLDATPEMLLGWRAGLTAGGDTIRGYVTHVKGFYRWAAEAGHREDNPAAAIPVPKVTRRLPRPVGEDDLMRALAAAVPRIRIWLALAAWAGLRAKEIALLRRDSIRDTTSPPVLIIAHDATKGSRERVVPISPFLLGELHDAGLPLSGYAFRRLRGPGPNRPSRISQACNQHLHDCGVPATLHQLRHRFLTEAYRATKDIRLVQELAGHASPQTTAGYIDVDQDGAVAAVWAIPVPGPRLRAVAAGAT
jgi:integrase/recombinase XerC